MTSIDTTQDRIIQPQSRTAVASDPVDLSTEALKDRSSQTAQHSGIGFQLRQIFHTIKDRVIDNIKDFLLKKTTAGLKKEGVDLPEKLATEPEFEAELDTKISLHAKVAATKALRQTINAAKKDPDYSVPLTAEQVDNFAHTLEVKARSHLPRYDKVLLEPNRELAEKNKAFKLMIHRAARNLDSDRFFEIVAQEIADKNLDLSNPKSAIERATVKAIDLHQKIQDQKNGVITIPPSDDSSPGYDDRRNPVPAAERRELEKLLKVTSPVIDDKRAAPTISKEETVTVQPPVQPKTIEQEMKTPPFDPSSHDLLKQRSALEIQTVKKAFEQKMYDELVAKLPTLPTPREMHPKVATVLMDFLNMPEGAPGKPSSEALDKIEAQILTALAWKEFSRLWGDQLNSLFSNKVRENFAEAQFKICLSSVMPQYK